MTDSEHQAYHARFHQQLDKAVACFISVTEALPSDTTLMEFMEWNHRMISGAIGDEGENNAQKES